MSTNNQARSIDNGDATMAFDEHQVSNGAVRLIESLRPYVATVEIVGVAPLLFRAWNIESIEEKAVAAKGSKAKKSDDIEASLYRDGDGYLCVPCMNFVAALRMAARYVQDPRSPRKSAHDLVEAGICAIESLARLEPWTKDYDFLHRSRVTVQRSGITRTRPAMNTGWKVQFTILVSSPEYLSPTVVSGLINQAGRLEGICDFRPTYGRFTMTGFTVSSV